MWLKDKEDVVAILEVGRSIKDKICGLTADEVKELYIFLIEQRQIGRCSNKDIIDGVKFILPELKPYERERIAITELHRMLIYEKVIELKKPNKSDYVCSWSQCTCFTSPLDNFLRDGELTSDNYRYVDPYDNYESEVASIDSPEIEGNSIVGYDYEYLRPELPEWTDGIYSLEELRNMINSTYAVFYRYGIERGEMLTDWLTPSCSHTIMYFKGTK